MRATFFGIRSPRSRRVAVPRVTRDQTRFIRQPSRCFHRDSTSKCHFLLRRAHHPSRFSPDVSAYSRPSRRRVRSRQVFIRVIHRHRVRPESNATMRATTRRRRRTVGGYGHGRSRNRIGFRKRRMIRIPRCRALRRRAVRPVRRQRRRALRMGKQSRRTSIPGLRGRARRRSRTNRACRGRCLWRLRFDTSLSARRRRDTHGLSR